MSNRTVPVDVRELKKTGVYIAAVGLHKGEKDVQGELNKVELAFKAAGIKNIKAIPYQFGLFEVIE